MHELIKNAKRIVFKFGTNVLTSAEGGLALSRIYSFMEDMARLKAKGKEIIVVTSGAVGLGAQRLHLTEMPDLVSIKQACAAVGQCGLMKFYEDGFAALGLTTAQVLLTEEDFSIRPRYLSLRDTLCRLLELGVVPIINQNDTVSTNELRAYKDKGVKVCFGDNDKLSALVAGGLDADLLVILSDINGLYDSDPRKNKDAKLIAEVKAITPEIESAAGGASKRGRGGMKTKLEAAKVVTHSGCAMVIANGKTPGALGRVFSDEFTGTLFRPVADLPGKKVWIAYSTNMTGGVVVNAGAFKALCQKGASLLAAGITGVAGEFDVGDVISVFDENGAEFAKGMVNYSSADCGKILGCQSEDIAKKLGGKNYDEVIHRDNIVIL